MIAKIKQWWRDRQLRKQLNSGEADTFTRAQVREMLAEARQLAYNDGKRDGLSIAREQATKSLKEILWQQNHPTTKNQQR